MQLFVTYYNVVQDMGLTLIIAIVDKRCYFPPVESLQVQSYLFTTSTNTRLLGQEPLNQMLRAEISLLRDAVRCCSG